MRRRRKHSPVVLCPLTGAPGRRSWTFRLLLTAAVVASSSAGDAPSSSCPAGASTAECISSATASSPTSQAEDYFKSYGTAYVQAEMLLDEVRTNAFRDAIIKNHALFEGKVVLDVGCGTGILSLFAARAGAKKVIAVERSDMAHIARRIVNANGLNGTVEVVHGLLEDIELPPASVDIIVSEWIGTFLVHESMLDSVFVARDRWLKPGGLILPDSASLHLAGIDDQVTDLASWKSFNGFDFTALGEAWRGVAAQQCAIRRTLATEAADLMTLDLYTATKADAEFHAPFSMPWLQGKDKPTEVHALVSWFVLGFFGAPSRKAEGLGIASELTTHPDATCTHWQQTFMFLKEMIPLSSTPLSGSISVGKSSSNPRDLDVNVRLQGIAEEAYIVAGADC